MAIIQEYLTTEISLTQMVKNITSGGPLFQNEAPVQIPMSEETKKPEKKAELDREKLKNLALNTMIEVAEEELQIDIRKIPGAKQRAKLDRHTIRNLITTIKNTQRME